MNFWNQFTKTLSTTADKTAKGAEKLADIAKIQYRISSLNKKLEDTYQTLGKLCYAEHCGEKVLPETYLPLIDGINELTAQIREEEVKLSRLRGDIPCQRCGNRIKKGTAFCPNCGEKIDNHTTEG